MNYLRRRRVQRFRPYFLIVFLLRTSYFLRLVILRFLITSSGRSTSSTIPHPLSHCGVPPGRVRRVRKARNKVPRVWGI